MSMALQRAAVPAGVTPSSLVAVFRWAICGCFAPAAGWAADPPAPEVPLPPMRNVEIPALKVENTPRNLPLQRKLPDPARRMKPAQPAKSAEVNGLLDLLGGEENLRIALAPDRIEVSRLTAKHPPTTGIGDCTEDKPIQLSAADAKIIRDIITNDESYNWEAD